MVEQNAFDQRLRKAVQAGDVRLALFGAALVLLCAVGLSGCGARAGDDGEPLEQGEWLVSSDPHGAV